MNTKKWLIFTIITILCNITIFSRAEAYPSLNHQIEELIKASSSAKDKAEVYVYIRNSGRYEQIKLAKGHIVLVYDLKDNPRDNLNTITEIEKLLNMKIFAQAKQYLENTNLQIGILLGDVLALTNNRSIALNSLLNPSKESSDHKAHGIILFHNKLSTKYKVSRVDHGQEYEYRLEDNAPLVTLLNEIHEIIDSDKYSQNRKPLFTEAREYQALSIAIDRSLIKTIVSNYKTNFASASPQQRDEAIHSSSANISSDWLIKTLQRTKPIHADYYKQSPKLENKRAAELAAKALTERLHNYYPWATDVSLQPSWNQHNQEFVIRADSPRIVE